MNEIEKVDFLVIGSGIAGLTFAIKAAAHGSVLVVTKKENTESNTNRAQGGIAAVLHENDSVESHVRDTLVAGAGLCHEEAVRVMVSEGPSRVRELIRFGVRFSRGSTSGGRRPLALGMEGGHSHRRIAHADDLTGREIERALVAAATAQERIRFYEHHLALDLLMLGGACVGATVLDSVTGSVGAALARATMLTTGGCGRVYHHTTNPIIATGDGVAMAYRAGARIANMEFIQFHPTALAISGADSFLISEAVRGEGGLLRRLDGERFMPGYHERAELAPRDVVARAIDAELKRTGDSHVLLDVTHLDGEETKARFPNIYRRCLDFGVDITREAIPVTPSAHYACGGVCTSTRGATDIPRLFAAGEVAWTGVHGANRLASNSLLEAVVFGHRAIAASRATGALTDAAEGEARRQLERLGGERSPVDPVLVHHERDALQRILWDFAGIIRTRDRLERAWQRAGQILESVEKAYSIRRLEPELAELRSLVTVAVLVVRSALERRESRGLHRLLGSPEASGEARDTFLCRGEGGLPRPLGDDSAPIAVR